VLIKNRKPVFIPVFSSVSARFLSI
jgi:hypothetical protein